MSAMTAMERKALLDKARDLDRQLYPANTAQMPEGRERSIIEEAYFRVAAEYADRLPRVPMSVCPHTGDIFRKSFDPWGVDGFWWHKDREVDIEEPVPPPTRKVLLGALHFHGRTPKEAAESVLPGPEVPFVVPRLLELPGMVAVISSLKMHTGDTAYPIAYFSTETIEHPYLHQFWLDEDYWFEQDGKSGWLIANDIWDFDLEPWIRRGKLRWTDIEGDTMKLVEPKAGNCPFINLPGDRQPQSVGGGVRELLDLPDGTPVNPYED
jgi:hypothetical protein